MANEIMCGCECHIEDRPHGCHSCRGNHGDKKESVPTQPCVRCGDVRTFMLTCHRCDAPLCDAVCEEWHLEKGCEESKAASPKLSERSVSEEELQALAEKIAFRLGMTRSVSIAMIADTLRSVLHKEEENRG